MFLDKEIENQKEGGGDRREGRKVRELRRESGWVFFFLLKIEV